MGSQRHKPRLISYGGLIRIVVTGALGHIGSKLIRRLPECELILIDNLQTQAYYSLFDLDRPHKFINEDILTAKLLKIFDGADAVIHLAAIVDPEKSYDQKELVEQVNVEGTRRVAEACLEVGCPMIFASTTSVYGVQEDEVDENCTTLAPQSPYAVSKITSENILRELGSKGLYFTILRMGTIFGISKGMRFHTAVNRFCFQAAIGQPITVWKTAINQNRPYLDLDDMVRTVDFILAKNLFTNEVYNLVTVNTTVGNIIDIIKKQIPDLSINYVDTRIMSQLSYTISNKKFRDLGFQFKGNIEQGITDTLELLA